MKSQICLEIDLRRPLAPQVLEHTQAMLRANLKRALDPSAVISLGSAQQTKAVSELMVLSQLVRSLRLLYSPEREPDKVDSLPLWDVG